MAENLGKRPSKGILKTSSSFEKPDAPKRKQKETKWDEMNIIATLHPPDKEYGHMKIEEPKTPFNWVDEDAMVDELDAAVLAEKIRLEATKPPKSIEEDSESEEDSEDETDEMKAKRVAFESKRKAHYNEYYAVKLARKLMEQEEEVEEDDYCEHDDAVEMEEDDKHAQQTTENSASASNMNCVTVPAATGHCS
ncbi:protein phosphatase inhibitor 2-like [Schistocerca nitens]|uniref:protein phosphatase inhibitor 2-like n=1 Tax=Schistocerca nitens TaxID=7011 RepID=UPI002117390C|nr:protein phosphatase inhibitor 2-like [Schistocerca nitens]